MYNDEFFTEGWWEDPTKLALAWKFLGKADFEARHKWVREEPFTKEYLSKYWEIRRVQTVQAKMGVEVSGWFDDRTDFAFEALTDILQMGGFDTTKIRRNVFGLIMWQTLEVINSNESVKELYRQLIHYKESIREFEWAIENLAQFFITLGVSQYFASLRATNAAKLGSDVYNDTQLQYSVAYRMKLSNSSYPGLSRAAHFREANQELLRVMEANPEFAQRMEQMIPGITDFLRGSGIVPSRSPTSLGWTWHHSIETGIMELVPYNQHISPLFQSVFHPDGIGGYAIWGK